MKFEDLKILLDAIESLVTLFAVLTGGFWTYLLFVKRRQKYPRAWIKHAVSFTNIPGYGRLIHIDVTLKNIGEVLLSIVYVKIEIKQILPPNDQLKRIMAQHAEGSFSGIEIVNWKSLGKYEDAPEENSFEVEPGEEHQFQINFFVPAATDMIMLETYIANAKKERVNMFWQSSSRDIGWLKSTIHGHGVPQEDSDDVEEGVRAHDQIRSGIATESKRTSGTKPFGY